MVYGAAMTIEKREGRTWRETAEDLARECGYNVKTVLAQYDKHIEVDALREPDAVDQALDWADPTRGHRPSYAATFWFDRPLSDQKDPVFRAFARLARAYAERVGEDIEGALLHSGAFHELSDGCETQHDVSVNVCKIARRLNAIHESPARYLPPKRFRVCQAEDQGGWPACDEPAELQTKAVEDGKRRYYCLRHRTNRHVWSADEVEPIAEDPKTV